MQGRRVWRGIAVVAMGFGLAACGSGANSASSVQTTKASMGVKTSTTVRAGGTNPNSDFCKNLAQENATETKLSKNLASAVQSNNLTTVKAAFGSFLVATQSELVKVKGAAASSPDTVKAAFVTVTAFYEQLKATVANATSVSQLKSGVSSLMSAKSITRAGSTISGYVTAQCGSTTTSST